jgi:hypothetical protein
MHTLAVNDHMVAVNKCVLAVNKHMLAVNDHGLADCTSVTCLWWQTVVGEAACDVHSLFPRATEYMPTYCAVSR